MTSEEIIQRLLDDRKITAREALVILKDLAKIGIQKLSTDLGLSEPTIPDITLPESNLEKDDWKNRYPIQVVTMYGVQPTIYDATNSNFSDLLNDKIDNATGNKQNL